MGNASRDVQARAKEKVQEGLDEASAVAGRTLDAVREEVNARADA